MKRIGVLTSGGDAPGMNAAIRAVVRTAIANDMSVVGFKRGYNGVLMYQNGSNDDYEIMTRRSVGETIHRGGTFLMTARCKEFHEVEVQKKAISNMRLLGLEGLVVIGGDGTFRGANAMTELGFPVVGIPGTIDNDLPYTDYTLGFDTAVNTACECINKIRETSGSHERGSLVTVMGRNCGDIALHTAIASGADIVLLPERPWSIEELAGRIKWSVLEGKRSTIIVMAEGAMDSLTSDVPALVKAHPELGVTGEGSLSSSKLAALLEILSGHEIRATVLGYIQRGGTPSASDRLLGSRFGEHAVKLLRDDIGGMAVGIRENKIIEVPFAQAFGSHRPVNDQLMELLDTLST
ncbi:MAG: 6-phosphofructokinase [Clostridia bacterium]|nr:6-phosphofructokinase [Clostridia bacterium]